MACDNILSDSELRVTNKHTGDPEDLCSICRSYTNYSLDLESESLDRDLKEVIDSLFKNL